jgi:methionyl-tRNA formyltransferase
MSFNVVFMGTPEFSIPTLEILVKEKFNILSVYTQPPKKSKRGQKINISPVEEFCKNNKLNFRTPINLNTDGELKKFKKLSPDIVIVAAYGKIIPKSYFGIAKFGFINLHASLLPKWRGAAPIQRAIMNGEKKIGVSIMRIEEKLDSGAILATKELILDQNETHGEVEKKISAVGANLLIKSLKIIKDGNAKFVDQIHSKATYAKKIDKGETKINWRLDADKVLSHIHGLSPKPGAWFEYKKERFKVLRVKITKLKGVPGLVIEKNLTVGCRSNSIQILELQRQGKNKQTTKEFLLGKKISIGSILA